jgi:hypothetical protein
MLRSIGWVLLGAAGGVALGFFLNPAPEAGLAGQARPAATVGEATTELSAYRAASQITDAAALEAALEQAQSGPFSVEREASVRAHFERLAAVDVRRASRFASTPGFDVELVADVFRDWAEVDANAALEELAMIEDPVVQRVVATALLDVQGYNASAIDRIASALPEYQRVDFQANALAKLAEDDPRTAINAAVSMRDAQARSSALLRAGAAWAQHDPIAAFAETASLPPELQAAYRNSVATAWSEIDTDGFLTYASAQPALDDLLPGLMHAMAVHPERVFEVAAAHRALPIGEGFAPYVTVERTAFTGLVMSEPERALAVLEAMPAGERRRALTIAAAESYGRVWPDEAYAWVTSLQPRDAVLETSVIAYSAAPIDQKLQWYYDYENPEDLTPYARNPLLATWNYIANIMGGLAGGHPDRALIASRLRERGDERSMALLARMTGPWVNSDPEGALDWMLASGEVDPAIASNIGSQLASRDARAAAAYVDRLPQELREPWLQEVAVQYAAQDPEGASAWITGFQGDPGYDAMLGQMVARVAQSDPRIAARMLLSAPGEIQQGVADNIAAGWAQSDLAGAARWASGLNDESARSSAVRSVANSWAYRDPGAAQRWAANLPNDADRDAALAAVLTRLTRDGFDTTIDTRLLGEFSSDSARNRQASQIVMAIASHDPDRAETVLERWVTDPALKQLGEDAIAQGRERAGR